MSIEIGTILVETYGWSSLGHNFYKVASVSKTGKSITVERIGSKMVENYGYGQSGKEVPDETKSYGIVMTDKGKFVDHKWVKILKPRQFKLNSDGAFGSAYNRMRVWDGKACTFYCD